MAGGTSSRFGTTIHVTSSQLAGITNAVGCVERRPALIELVFVYDTGNAEEFEGAYGADGDWAQFFRTGRGYVGTELLKDLEQPGRYLVIDRWESREAYNAFVAEHRDDYMRRVDESAFLYERELRFGTFESVWSEQ